MSNLLAEIARAAAHQHEQDTAIKAREAETSRRVAEAQYDGLSRWYTVIRPAIDAKVMEINAALGGPAKGSCIAYHSSTETEIRRGQIYQGRQMQLKLRLVLVSKPPSFITFSLDANYGPDAVVLTIAHGDRHVVSLVVDEAFRKEGSAFYLERIVHAAVVG